MAYGFISRVHVDERYLFFAHGGKAEVLKEVVVEIDVGLAGVKHHPITVKNDNRYFVYSLQHTTEKMYHLSAMKIVQKGR